MSKKSYKTPVAVVKCYQEDIITASGGEKGEMDFFIGLTGGDFSEGGNT